MADPSDIDDLQRVISELTEERDKLKSELDKAVSFQVQYDELKTKYDKAIQTNMDLIRHIPAPVEGAKDEPKDISRMTDTDRYAYLKEMAVKSFEKE